MLAVIAFGKDRHDLAVFQRPADVACDRARIFLHIAPNQRMIAAFGRAVEKLLRQARQYVFGLRDHHQPRCVFIEPVHEPGTAGIISRFRQVLKMEHHRVHKRAGVVSVTGMHDHVGRFVDNREVFVLIGDLDRNVLRDQLDFSHRVRQHDGDFIPGLDLVIRLDRDFVDQDIPVLRCDLDLVARRIRQAVHQELVDAQHLLPFVRLYGMVLKQLILLVLKLLYFL